MADSEQKYTVYLQNVTSTSITVSARNPDEAAEAAFDSEDLPGDLCASCSGWGQRWSRDDGEWEAYEITDESGEIVWSARKD